jgi:hypothetical protein
MTPELIDAGIVWRTPGPPPFSSMNSTLAASNAERIPVFQRETGIFSNKTGRPITHERPITERN